MGKRFGRNQKRKMKQALREADAKLDASRQREVRLSKIVDDTAQILGNHFIGLPPQDIRLSSTQQLCEGVWRIIRQAYGPGHRLDLVEKTLDVLRFASHEELNELGVTELVHLRFKLGGKVVGYALTKHALGTMPRPVAVEYISKRMAEMMYHDVVGKHKKGPSVDDSIPPARYPHKYNL